MENGGLGNMKMKKWGDASKVTGVPPFFKRESFYIIAIIEERAVFNCKEAP